MRVRCPPALAPTGSLGPFRVIRTHPLLARQVRSDEPNPSSTRNKVSMDPSDPADRWQVSSYRAIEGHQRPETPFLCADPTSLAGGPWVSHLRTRHGFDVSQVLRGSLPRRLRPASHVLRRSPRHRLGGIDLREGVEKAPGRRLGAFNPGRRSSREGSGGRLTRSRPGLPAGSAFLPAVLARPANRPMLHGPRWEPLRPVARPLPAP